MMLSVDKRMCSEVAVFSVAGEGQLKTRCSVFSSLCAED